MTEYEEQEQQERSQLFEFAVLGREVDEFLSSRTGRYVLNRAETEFQKAMHELKVVDPTDSKQIMLLQNQAQRAESFREWLIEAIQSGKNAEVELENRDFNANG